MKRSYVDMDYVYGTLSNSDGETPAAAEKLCERAQRYNEGVALAQEYARQKKD